MTNRAASRCAGLSTAAAVLVAAVSPLLCLCANAAPRAEPPACHAAAPAERPAASLAAPCCCVGVKRESALALTASDERAPKLLPTSPAPTANELAAAPVELAASGLCLPSAHSPPGLRAQLRI